MLHLISWVVFGFFIGCVAKFLHPGQDGFKGFLPTIVVGICGSFLGGAVNFLTSADHHFGPSGIIMSILGSIVLLYGYDYYLKSYGK